MAENHDDKAEVLKNKAPIEEAQKDRTLLLDEEERLYSKGGVLESWMKRKDVSLTRLQNATGVGRRYCENLRDGNKPVPIRYIRAVEEHFESLGENDFFAESLTDEAKSSVLEKAPRVGQDKVEASHPVLMPETNQQDLLTILSQITLGSSIAYPIEMTIIEENENDINEKLDEWLSSVSDELTPFPLGLIGFDLKASIREQLKPRLRIYPTLKAARKLNLAQDSISEIHKLLKSPRNYDQSYDRDTDLRELFSHSSQEERFTKALRSLWLNKFRVKCLVHPVESEIFLTADPGQYSAIKPPFTLVGTSSQFIGITVLISDMTENAVKWAEDMEDLINISINLYERGTGKLVQEQERS